MPPLDEELMGRAFAPARDLRESDAVVETALRSARGAKSSWWRRPWAMLCVLLVVLVPATAVAVNAINGAVPGSAGDAFTNYLAGVEAQTWPGAPYEGDPPPGARHGGPSKLLSESGSSYSQPRILARRGPVAIYAAKTENGEALVLEVPGVIMGESRDSLFEFADRKLLRLYGGTNDRFLRRGVTPLYGLANTDVSAVRVIYRMGPRSPQVKADGGFIVLVDPKRKPVRIQGLDATGRVVGEIPAGGEWHDAAREIFFYRRDHSP